MIVLDGGHASSLRGVFFFYHPPASCAASTALTLFLCAFWLAERRRRGCVMTLREWSSHIATDGRLLADGAKITCACLFTHLTFTGEAVFAV
jgi:hypothetical protein